MIKYGSVCSGIEAASVAWRGLGWQAQWLSEIDTFPCKVLAHHYPTVPNLGDMTALLDNEQFKATDINLLVGGTPCQSFSLAGLRGGMADDRGNLALIFCKLLLAKQPTWFVWENVPGVFSSFTDDAESTTTEVNGGTPDIFGNPGGGRAGGVYEECEQTADFATLLQGFQECGYSCAWRVLNSEYFGVPQRRRRVFVVGHLGNDWRPPFAVLFERESLRRDITPSKEKAQGHTGNAGNGTKGKSERVEGFRMTAFGEYEQDQTASALKRRDYKDATDLVVYGIDEEGNSKINHFGALMKGGEGTTRQSVAVMRPAATSIIRRLTPTECERLQGFPDKYVTGVAGASDNSCYKALGNSMTTNVMKWIGERIDKVNDLLKPGE